MPPPDLGKLVKKLEGDDEQFMPKLMSYILKNPQVKAPYLPWDKIRYKNPPEGFSHEEWWYAIKIQRQSMMREIPLADKTGRRFKFALPDTILKAIEEVNKHLSGHIGIAEQVTNPATKDRYLVNSLIEEAITSSQLEGASTSRKVAKEMIRSGRPPKDHDEKMILNNYRAMRRIGELRTEPLSRDLIFEIHRIVTEETLENADAAGRFQRPDEERVSVFERDGTLLHVPPAASELSKRVDAFCAFANGETDGTYIPPVIRAIVIHFMIGYDHPFEDGNGRTARALFYWSMLHQDYWLTEFLSISRILRGAPSKYARSYLYTEQDGGDLTYFIGYQLEVLQRAIRDLHQYLDRKIQEVRDFQTSLATKPGEFNHRQVAVLQHALQNPDANFTAQSHARSHNVARETARQDLVELEGKDLLVRAKIGRAFVWMPVADIVERLRGKNL